MHGNVDQLPTGFMYVHFRKKAVARFLIRLAFGTGRFGGLQGLVYVFDLKAKVIDAFAPAMSRM